MSERFMRVFVFFDLPTLTSADKKEYRRFRKFIIEQGFMMMQQSVYCKMALNGSIVRSTINQVRKNKPAEGLVQTLVVTERQYANMEYIIGESHSTLLADDQRLVIL